MEEIVEVGIKSLLRIIRFVLIEAFCETLMYWIGRCFLLIMTLGKYPRGRQVDMHEGRIIFTGFVVIIITVVLITVYV